MYMGIARSFLEFVGKTEGITADDVTNYIAFLRSEGQAEVTLRGKMFRLKKLNQVCKFFDWPFTRDDIPTPPADYEPVTPTLSLEQIEKLIRAQDKYSDAERFFLAVSTTYGCRRESLSQIASRNIAEEYIIVPGAKGGRSIKHLMPPVLKPVLLAYHAKKHSARALSYIFHSIADKAGLETPKAFKSQGLGWHSIRRGVNTILEYAIPQCKGPDGKPLPQSVQADFLGWSKIEKGKRFMGGGMAGHYSHFETKGEDPYWLDRCIYAGHPLLKVWKEALKAHPVKKTSGLED
jgi:hypothetical protein